MLALEKLPMIFETLIGRPSKPLEQEICPVPRHSLARRLTKRVS